MHRGAGSGSYQGHRGVGRPSKNAAAQVKGKGGVNGKGKGVNPNGRSPDTIDKPFVYGSAAFAIKKDETKPDDQHTHKWTVYLRGLENEDLSTFIQRVDFRLHESFTDHVRGIEKPPYEVTETGWGEFSILIKVHFRDPNEKPVQFYHHLKLFRKNKSDKDTGPVISEVYDEFVFHQPTYKFRDLLLKKPERHFNDYHLNKHFDSKQFVKMEQEHIGKLQTASKKVNERMDQLRQNLYVLDEEIMQLEKIMSQN
mmetsp:Transcript_12786/g.17890  ORF Transcript_12786/g.17890 Transcript_12786/m.17890 type:complete len:254 (-) Transcript_12786:166-927(-)